MKVVSMSGSLRENVGKKDAKQLRKADLVPCVLYGGKQEQIRFSVPQKEFKPLLFTPDTHYVELSIEGKQFMAILQEIQYHPVSDEVLHADFLQIFNDKPITVSVPIKTIGTAPGVLQGGKLEVKIRKMKLKGLPDILPQYVEIDVSKLEIAQSVKVEDIVIEKAEILNVKSSIVVWVKPTRNSAKATTTGEA
ncbi:MAG: 50S ribosomal protein L25/general stress protein Ctc [Bacteroidales bacterium]|jgi:large subunit ribosomal protein L25|nr:50S ribosomal protein L25/general stress protein Ctc [Bacteroidales bacterium]